MNNPADPFDLDRFIRAQQHTYEVALAEIKAGAKQSHWMWFIFPQFQGLGFSPTSQAFSIKSQQEAEAYLRHPVLGPRLIECATALLAVEGKSARAMMGSPDHLKLRSCATLFAQISPAGSVFHRLLEKFYEGKPDERTLQLVRGRL